MCPSPARCRQSSLMGWHGRTGGRPRPRTLPSSATSIPGQANWYAGLSQKTGPDLLQGSVKVKLQVFMPRRDVLFVALPFEVFTATSRELLSSMEQLGLDRQRVFITSCANEIHGYLRPASGAEGRWYDARMPDLVRPPGWYAEGAEAHVRENVVRLAEGLLPGAEARARRNLSMYTLQGISAAPRLQDRGPRSRAFGHRGCRVPLGGDSRNPRSLRAHRS